MPRKISAHEWNYPPLKIFSIFVLTCAKSSLRGFRSSEIHAARAQSAQLAQSTRHAQSVRLAQSVREIPHSAHIALYFLLVVRVDKEALYSIHQ